MIFHVIPSSRDLYALIQVSSIIYNIFAEHKLAILTNFIRQSYHPDVLPIAVLLSYIYNDHDAQKIDGGEADNGSNLCPVGNFADPKFLAEYPVLERYTKLRQELIDLKDKGGDVMSIRCSGRNSLQEKEVTPVRDDVLMLSTLCRIYCIIDAFIHLYSMDMFNSLYWERKRRTEGLSKSERGRFQYATLNYMTYDCFESTRVAIPWGYVLENALNNSEFRELNMLYGHVTAWTDDCFNSAIYYALERKKLEEEGIEEQNAECIPNGVRRCRSIQGISSSKLRLFLEKEKGGRTKALRHILDRGIPFYILFFNMTLEEQIDVALPHLGQQESCQ